MSFLDLGDSIVGTVDGHNPRPFGDKAIHQGTSQPRPGAGNHCNITIEPSICVPSY